jgi:hypothetical protein
MVNLGRHKRNFPINYPCHSDASEKILEKEEQHSELKSQQKNHSGLVVPIAATTVQQQQAQLNARGDGDDSGANEL